MHRGGRGRGTSWWGFSGSPLRGSPVFLADTGQGTLAAMLGSLRHRLLGSRASAWVLVAVAVRALVPDGFMIGTAPDGGATVIFCHGAGAMPEAAPGDQHDHAAHHEAGHSAHAGHSQHTGHAQHAGHELPDGAPAGEGGHDGQGQCAFAASSVLAPPASPAVAPALSLAGPGVQAQPVTVALPQARALRPGARAPPSFS